MAAMTSKLLFNIRLSGSEGSYSQIVVVVSTTAIFVIWAMTSTFPRLTTWARHLWTVWSCTNTVRETGQIKQRVWITALTGVGSPCYPIEGIVGDEALQWHHKGSCCSMCCQAWRWEASVRWLRLENNTYMFVYKHTFVLSALIIPTRLHTPTKYRPRFPPLCSPDTGRNPITSDLNLHLPLFTSIQWAVTPRNDAFVVSTDQQSAVVKTKPGAAWSIWKVSWYVFNETFLTLLQSQCSYLPAIGRTCYVGGSKYRELSASRVWCFLASWQPSSCGMRSCLQPRATTDQSDKREL